LEKRVQPSIEIFKIGAKETLDSIAAERLRYMTTINYVV